MATIDQVRAQIRFALDQLSVRSGHHEFEHLCRHFARQRVCSNILPATGPVSAGGDQARDFETFRTYLGASSIASSSFVGRAIDKPLAFCCSLEKSIKPKIRADVATVVNSGTPVEAIYYFCSADLAVAARHTLQKWALTKWNTHLEIFDGFAISEQLSDPDLFWVAEQCLQIPREMYPDRPSPAQWYSETRSRWHNDEPFLTPAEFFSAKSAARYALSEAEVDVGFWLTILGEFEAHPEDTHLSRKASYEIAVLSLRSGRTLQGHEEKLREYFRAIPRIEDPEELEDALNLLQYILGARQREQVDLLLEEISTWWKHVRERVADLLRTSSTSGRSALLLEILGRASLFRVDGDGGKGTLDVDAAMKYWLDAMSEIKLAVLFPLERFASFVTHFAGVLGEHADYSRLTGDLDQLLVARTGGYAAATHARDRALAFHARGRVARAIKELHSTRVRWFTDETLRGGVLSMLLLSEWYSELGLMMAAKYYALAAVFVIARSGKPDVEKIQPSALSAVAAIDYKLGNWSDVAATARLAMGSHLLDSIEPEAFEKHPGILACVYHAALILTIGDRIEPELSRSVAIHLKDCPFSSSFTDVKQAVASHWNDLSAFDLWTKLEEEFHGRPFSDVEPIRIAKWRALGVTWQVSWENVFETHPIAEYLVALLQIFIADLADADLCLLPTSVEVRVVRGSIFQVKSKPSNAKRQWRVELPDSLGAQPDDWKDASTKMVQVLGALLAEVSVLKTDTFMGIMKQRFKDGLNHKLLAGFPYPVLYRDVMSKETFDSFLRSGKSRLPRDRSFKLAEPSDLEWPKSLGPGYSEPDAQAALANRYSHYLKPIQVTLRRLSRSHEFARTVSSLRRKRWLDWHILGVVCGVAVSYRITGNKRTERSVDEVLSSFKEGMNRTEVDADPAIPVSEFTEEALLRTMHPIMLSTLTVLGFECRQRTPDFPAIERFLGERFRYWSDDIPHEDFFAFPTES